MIKPILKFVFASLILIFVYFLDINSSKYGNGLFHKYYELNYEAELTHVEGVWITYEAGLCYMCPSNEYITKNKDNFLISKITGYKNAENNLIIRFESLYNGEDLCFVFRNKESVYSSTPVVLSFEKAERKYGSKGWVDFEYIPPVYYYWRAICLFLVLFSIIIYLSSLVSLMKFFMKK